MGGQIHDASRLQHTSQFTINGTCSSSCGSNYMPSLEVEQGSDRWSRKHMKLSFYCGIDGKMLTHKISCCVRAYRRRHFGGSLV
jgi:hypothetical protein